MTDETKHELLALKAVNQAEMGILGKEIVKTLKDITKNCRSWRAADGKKHEFP
jgi:hypothetical protein